MYKKSKGSKGLNTFRCITSLDACKVKGMAPPVFRFSFYLDIILHEIEICQMPCIGVVLRYEMHGPISHIAPYLDSM